MKDGKLVHRMVSPQQAALLPPAIANYRRVDLLRLLPFLCGGPRQIALRTSPCAINSPWTTERRPGRATAPSFFPATVMAKVEDRRPHG